MICKWIACIASVALLHVANSTAPQQLPNRTAFERVPGMRAKSVAPSLIQASPLRHSPNS